MKVAVVGCGIAGSTAAFLLREQGHDVTLLEQAPRCGPVGAGILLQPGGQQILQRLNLLDAVKATSARIYSLHAQHQNGHELVHLEYARLGPEAWGLGVHRGELFRLLWERCHKSGVEIREGSEIKTYKQSDTAVTLEDTTGRRAGEFDIVVAADGSRSRMRLHSKREGRVREYEYAALWMTAPCENAGSQLLQVVGRSGRLIGILPIGNDRASFFWGIRKTEKETIWSAGLPAWKDQVMKFFPAAAEILAGITSLEQMTYATYRSVRMRSVVHGRVVFIGDAAHASSPHLGQGANLALADAECLADQLAATTDFSSAFKEYESARRSTTRYYTRLTDILTPFFQTDSRLRQFGRNVALPIMPKLPYIGTQMVRTLAGLKTGWLP